MIGGWLTLLQNRKLCVLDNLSKCDRIVTDFEAYVVLRIEHSKTKEKKATNGIHFITMPLRKTFSVGIMIWKMIRSENFR